MLAIGTIGVIVASVYNFLMARMLSRMLREVTDALRDTGDRLAFHQNNALRLFQLREAMKESDRKA